MYKLLFFSLAITLFSHVALGQDSIRRDVLPIPEPKRATTKELDVRKVAPPARFEVKAPKEAPNVVIVLIDDMGFGVADCFGGPVPMPTFSALARDGLRFNRFHTTAVCAPPEPRCLPDTITIPTTWGR